MKCPIFFMVAEIQRDDQGRILPKRYVSGLYCDYLRARQVSAELGDDYHVFEGSDFEDAPKKTAKDES